MTQGNTGYCVRSWKVRSAKLKDQSILLLLCLQQARIEHLTYSNTSNIHSLKWFHFAISKSYSPVQFVLIEFYHVAKAYHGIHFARLDYGNSRIRFAPSLLLSILFQNPTKKGIQWIHVYTRALWNQLSSYNLPQQKSPSDQRINILQINFNHWILKGEI